MEVEMKIRGLMMDPSRTCPSWCSRTYRPSDPADLGGRVRSERHRAGNRESANSRPMTHDLLKNVLLGLEVRVQKSCK